MTRWMTALLLALVIGLPAAGQQAPPQPKSQGEVDALMAIQNAQDADTRIEACQKLLTDFEDTEFKEMAYYMLMASYQQKNDFENMLIFGEKTLEVNPENVGALLSLAYAIPIKTKEFDLDKEEKLARAEDFAQRSLRIIPTLDPPNPGITPEEWLLTKKSFMSQAHESLGRVAMLRKDYPKAEGSFRQSLQVASEQDASMFFRLGQALKEQGKYDEALTALDQSIAKGGYKLPNGRDVAALLKAETVKLREQGASPPAAPEGSTPQVQINPEP